MTKRLVGMLGSLGLLAALSGLAPIAFRRIDGFRVHRVELAGARFLSPHEVVNATGISDSSNVFDDAGTWSRALGRHSLVAGVRIERRPPHTVRFHVLEAQPVALAPVPELVAVDATGRVLPIELAGSDLDLPVLGRRARVDEDSLVDEKSRKLIAFLVRIRSLDEQMAASISEIAPAGGGGIRIMLDQDGVEILLPDVPDARGLTEVRQALDHLAAEKLADPAGDGALPDRSRNVRIDARYRDELFVTLQPRRPS
jgi:cell division septal protein FtsQ